MFELIEATILSCQNKTPGGNRVGTLEKGKRSPAATTLISAQAGAGKKKRFLNGREKGPLPFPLHSQKEPPPETPVKRGAMPIKKNRERERSQVKVRTARPQKRATRGHQRKSYISHRSRVRSSEAETSVWGEKAPCWCRGNFDRKGRPSVTTSRR